jgi:D-threo-aldose 1-dehydrogenase
MNQWEMLYDFLREAAFDCFLLAGRYTLLDQGSLEKLLPECERRGVSIILGGPYNSGVLAVGSGGKGHYNYQEPPLEILSKVQALEAIAVRHDVPLRAAALQFPLAHPAVACVIPGARTPEEVEDNVGMFTHPIPNAFWEEIRAKGLVVAGAPLPLQ